MLELFVPFAECEKSKYAFLKNRGFLLIIGKLYTF
jgi:hypothetical protein